MEVSEVFSAKALVLNSLCHIQGSKIAKRLPSVKYSFTVLENRNFLKKNFSKKVHTQKNGPSGAPGLAR